MSGTNYYLLLNIILNIQYYCIIKKNYRRRRTKRCGMYRNAETVYILLI